MALPIWEKTVLALDPIMRTTPTVMPRITASITAYSAMSWPSVSRPRSRSRRINVCVTLKLCTGGRAVWNSPKVGDYSDSGLERWQSAPQSLLHFLITHKKNKTFRHDWRFTGNRVDRLEQCMDQIDSLGRKVE
jgi:hypothetical protein